LSLTTAIHVVTFNEDPGDQIQPFVAATATGTASSISLTVQIVNAQPGDYIQGSAPDSSSDVYLQYASLSSATDVQAMLQNVVFGNSGASPAPVTRNVTATASSSSSLQNITVAIEMVLFNDPPVLQLQASSLTYYEELNTPVALFPNASISDPDDGTVSMM